ncbi:MAG: response regulator transcription factor [Methylococcales bacterium]|nr:response regulator transcription factor [Methylococcales bacterium]
MWMAKGRNNNDIAAILELSERTIKFHIKNIMQKFNASNRTEAVAIAARTGWIIN